MRKENSQWDDLIFQNRDNYFITAFCSNSRISGHKITLKKLAVNNQLHRVIPYYQDKNDI